MFFSNKFICAGEEFCEIDRMVAAPYFRKEFQYDGISSAELTITGLGFYELYINGIKITKGYLSPYITNSNLLVYYDNYRIDSYLEKGENVIGVVLGNGMQNSYGGYVWAFDTTKHRSSPKLALALEIDGNVVLEADESFKTHPSPILEDDLRLGEMYDANLEICGWNLQGFDASQWNTAIVTKSPQGEKRLCEVKPIKVWQELQPVKIWREDDSYIYDFGCNLAGIPRLCINGVKGQKVNMIFGEHLKEGRFEWENITFFPKFEGAREYRQEDVYICKGEEKEIYEPSFTYHGFQYVKVSGITEEQATEQLLTYLVLNTSLESRGDFRCSDETLNKIQEMVRNSTLSNFHHFPTDCPHREKNGWTGDIGISMEQMILNWDVEANMKEWMRSLCKLQNEEGIIPGIVPTWEWGYGWLRGPAWEYAAVHVPYMLYRYRDDKEVLETSKDTIIKYLKYLDTQRNERGLFAIGLGDWVDPTGGEGDTWNVSHVKTPQELTDSIYCLDFAKTGMRIMEILDAKEEYDYCENFYEQVRQAIREHLYDETNYTFTGRTQTAQAMGIYYDILTDTEKEGAFRVLVQLIHESNDHLTTGCLGLRVLFHVLSEFGESDLAYKMITQPDLPSYGYFVRERRTTLGEQMTEFPASYNHHFLSDVSAWFIKSVCGIHYNEELTEQKKIVFKPHFLSALEKAEAYHICPEGKILSGYTKKRRNMVKMKLEIPNNTESMMMLPRDWTDERGRTVFPVATGEYTFYKTRERQ